MEVGIRRKSSVATKLQLIFTLTTLYQTTKTIKILKMKKLMTTWKRTVVQPIKFNASNKANKIMLNQEGTSKS